MSEYAVLIFGDDVISIKLERSGESAMDLRAVMPRILEDIYRVEKEIFSSQGHRGGGSWKQLKPDTIRRKKGRGQILVDTGALLRSVTKPGAKYQTVQLTSNSLEFSTTRPGAKAHQEGIGVPARPFMKFTGYDVDRWGNMISNYLISEYENA